MKHNDNPRNHYGWDFHVDFCLLLFPIFFFAFKSFTVVNHVLVGHVLTSFHSSDWIDCIERVRCSRQSLMRYSSLAMERCNTCSMLSLVEQRMQ